MHNNKLKLFIPRKLTRELLLFEMSVFEFYLFTARLVTPVPSDIFRENSKLSYYGNQCSNCNDNISYIVLWLPDGVRRLTIETWVNWSSDQLTFRARHIYGGTEKCFCRVQLAKTCEKSHDLCIEIVSMILLQCNRYRSKYLHSTQCRPAPRG